MEGKYEGNSIFNMHWKPRFGPHSAGPASSGRRERRCKSDGAERRKGARDRLRKDKRGDEQHANATERGRQPLSCAERDAANKYERDPAKQATVQ